MNVRRFSVGPLGTNCYLLTDPADGSAAVIDPGLDTPELMAALRPIAAQIRLILLTHRHFDHILGVAALRELTGASVAIHKLDAPGLADGRESLYEQFAEYYPHAQQPVKPDLLLEDGDEVSVGTLRLRVLHTPGHTVGGVCYSTGGTLFSGDTLFAQSAGRTDLPDGDSMALHRSLMRLRALEGDLRVLPGHGPESTLDRERRTNPYLGANRA